MRSLTPLRLPPIGEKRFRGNVSAALTSYGTRDDRSAAARTLARLARQVGIPSTGTWNDDADMVMYTATRR